MLFEGKKIKCTLRYKTKSYTYFLDKHKTIFDVLKLFKNDEPNIEHKISIRLYSSKYPFESKDLENPILSLEKNKYNELQFEITKPYTCSKCSKIISKYCLICNKYHCSKCDNKIHKEHANIDIDPTDFKESIKLWSINLDANLSSYISALNRFKNFVNDENLIKKIKLWKENTIKKLNVFEKFMSKIFEMFQNVSSIIDPLSDDLNKCMNNLSKTEQEMNMELNDVGSTSNGNDFGGKYFSFDEAEKLIQKLKINYNSINENAKKVKPITEIENINCIDDLMIKTTSCIEELSRVCLKINEDFNNSFFKEKTLQKTNKNLEDISDDRNISFSNIHLNPNSISSKLFKNLYSKGQKIDIKINDISVKTTSMKGGSNTNLIKKDFKNNYNTINGISETPILAYKNMSKKNKKKGDDNKNECFSQNKIKDGNGRIEKNNCFELPLISSTQRISSNSSNSTYDRYKTNKTNSNNKKG